MFVDSELDALIHDPAIERLRQRMLREMAADESDPVARDLARDLLSGAVTLTQAAGSTAYGDFFASQAEKSVEWWQGMSESERDELLAGAEESVRQYLAEEEPQR